MYIRTKLNITITPDRLIVKDYQFDRQHNPRFGIGFSDQGATAFSPSKSFAGLQTVRIHYGPWGENLNYLLPQLWAVEHLSWANTVIDSVKPPKKQTAKDGKREQKF